MGARSSSLVLSSPASRGHGLRHVVYDARTGAGGILNGNPFKIGGKYMTPGFWGANAAPYYGNLPPGLWMSGDGKDFTVSVVTSREQAVALFIDWIKHEPAWKVEYLAAWGPVSCCSS
jgi:hypothetical protein